MKRTTMIAIALNVIALTLVTVGSYQLGHKAGEQQGYQQANTLASGYVCKYKWNGKIVQDDSGLVCQLPNGKTYRFQ